MRTHIAITLAGAALGLIQGCAASDQDAADTSGASTPVTAAGSSGDAVSGGGTGPDTTGGPGTATATGITGDTDDTSATSGLDTSSDGGPTVYFDIGTTPDAPSVDPRCEQNLDIVFVMDVSTTMAQFLGIMSEEMLAVDAAVTELALLGEPHYGLAVFVDDHLLVNAGAPYQDALALQADFDTWATFAASNSQVGGGNSNSTWTENSLDALHAAATEFEWRPAATTTRIIVHTTDDTFWDGPTFANGVNIVHGYAETVDALQDASVRVYSFADDIGGSCNCDDVTPGWSSDYMGMPAIPVATDGGVFAIAGVLQGNVSLVDALDAAVGESFCEPYEPVG